MLDRVCDRVGAGDGVDRESRPVCGQIALGDGETEEQSVEALQDVILFVIVVDFTLHLGEQFASSPGVSAHFADKHVSYEDEQNDLQEPRGAVACHGGYTEKLALEVEALTSVFEFVGGTHRVGFI